ncbi:hypothetical protein Cyagr_0267 [Cyanobium gracile PCC 6307]|uniref:Uncharacterized protein n=1 Tax=Cyanobium gracile (strain ATCC 27147 / PCC 6307) TaxID=292564 RepID=K9P3B9_CYAGP|nr:hypothetical protein Cyagr_0267 [Cyanobium gracile PCC 6307]
MDDWLLGQRLAEALQTQSHPPPSHAIAVLSDLLGADVSLLLPLRDLVSRPGFQSLDSLRLGQGSRKAQRDALLQSLGETYNPQVLARLAAFLDGYLESQAPNSVSDGGSILPKSSAQPSTVPVSSWNPASTVPMTVIADPQDLATPPPGVPFASPPASASTASISDTRSSRRRMPLLVAGSVVVMALAVGAALRSNVLCAPFGLCSAASIAAANAALDEAQEAAVALGKAKDLTAYEQSLADLDRHLDKIETDALLGRTGQDTRKQLEEKARKGRDRLKQEEGHQLTVRQVKSGLDSTDAMPLEAATERRSALLRRLESVPSESFASSQAVALREELAPPRLQPVTVPTAPDPIPSLDSAPLMPQTPASAGRYVPPQSSSSPAATGGRSTGPYREVPLW